MRRVAATFVKAGAHAHSFASSASGEPAKSSWLETVSKTGSGLVAIVAAVGGAGYWIHTVDAKLAEVDARLSTKIDERLAGVEKGVDAKVAGVKETVTKEVDAKVAGVEKGVDAKVASMADKAKAEALMVLKDYGVSDVKCPLVVERQAHPNPHH
jgi:hypothetical protein